jgi:hypothetical protein
MLFETPAKLSDGRYFVKITNDDKSRLFKQINSCTVVGTGCYKIPVDLSEYDESIITKAAESSVEWFGKEISKDNLEKMYENSVTSDVFEAGLTKVKGKCITVVFDAKKQEISVDSLTVGVRCNIIVELAGIWFLKKSFGPVWRVIQARLISSETKYMFIDDDENPQDGELDLE